MAKSALRPDFVPANPIRRAPRVPAGANSLAAASTPRWIQIDGIKPGLGAYIFVFVRYAGETRAEAESYRDGYGQSVDSVANWCEVVEYRRKRHPVWL